MKKVLLAGFLLSVISAKAQNVAINSTGVAAVTSAALDVDMANKGILVPRVALTTTAAFAPVTGTATTSLLVYNTATASSGTTAVIPGYYYWDGAKWVRLLGGTSNTYWIVGASATAVNTPGATSYFGTSDNNHVDLVTNGTVRGRLSNLGEFFIGTTTTALAGDLMNGVSNATFPWAINGYSTQNGSGVYGAVQSGTTNFAGVQGEYSGTSTSGAGTRGIYISTTAGTAFNACPSGVVGTATSSGAYKFGVYGSGGTSARSGGVFGYNYGFSSGALGYYTSGFANVSVYGFGAAFTTGAAAGKGAGTKSITGMEDVNTNIGLGIYGGVMGGWVRGLVYGTHLKGEVYSLYVDGKTYATEPITQLVNTEGTNRQSVYSSAAMKVEISSRGKAVLVGGETYIPFTQEFKNTISTNPDELTITVSPMGNSNGIYIVSYDANGFTVKENNSGTSNVSFNWIAIGTRRDFETMEHAPEVIASDFDQKMDGVMFNENNALESAQSIWWDGTQVRFDAPPAKNYSKLPADASRMKVAPGAAPVVPVQQQ